MHMAIAGPVGNREVDRCVAYVQNGCCVAMRCDCHAQQPLFRLLDGFVFAPADRREEHHDQRNYRDREEGGANGCIDENHWIARSEEHTSELQSLMRISYAVFCLKKKNNN